MSDGRHLEKSKNVVLMDIINSLLKTGNKTANINVKNCSLFTMLTATDLLCCVDQFLLEPGLACALAPLILEKNLWDECHSFLRVGSPSYYPTNSVKALKGTQSIDFRQ